MPWLYQLQTRAGLTGPEGTAAVVLVLALAGGLAAQQMQAAATPVAPDFYAAADAAFVAADHPGAATAVTLRLANSAAAPADTTADSFRTAPVDTLGTDAPADVIDASTAEDPASYVDASPAAQADAVVARSARRSSGRKPPPVRTNINTATSEQLQRLPRIGPALAGRIIEYRRVHGRFGSAGEITEVRGIGDRTMELLTPWIHI